MLKIYLPVRSTLEITFVASEKLMIDALIHSCGCAIHNSIQARLCVVFSETIAQFRCQPKTCWLWLKAVKKHDKSRAVGLFRLGENNENIRRFIRSSGTCRKC